MNNKITKITIAIGLIGAIFGTGYLFAKNSTQGTEVDQVAQVAKPANNNHHGGPAPAQNSDILNSLVGKPLPPIRLLDADGKTYTPDDLKGKATVLFFSEGLMCYPACWNQIASFGSDERFNNEAAQAIAVVVDSASDWKKAINKMLQLGKAITMFDTDAKASRELGLLTVESSMHRGSLPGHTYILVDKEGIVRFVFDDPAMAIRNDMLAEKIEEINSPS